MIHTRKGKTMWELADELKKIKKAVEKIKEGSSDRDTDLMAADEILEAVNSIEAHYRA